LDPGLPPSLCGCCPPGLVASGLRGGELPGLVASGVFPWGCTAFLIGTGSRRELVDVT
jgi:hypothetical protein